MEKQMIQKITEFITSKIELPDVMTERQASQYMQISEKTLTKWRIQGIGPRFVKIGGLIRYRKLAIDDFLKSKEFNSTSEYTM